MKPIAQNAMRLKATSSTIQAELATNVLLERIMTSNQCPAFRAKVDAWFAIISLATTVTSHLVSVNSSEDVEDVQKDTF
jgi:hypothetical protein